MRKGQKRLVSSPEVGNPIKEIIKKSSNAIKQQNLIRNTIHRLDELDEEKIKSIFIMLKNEAIHNKPRNAEELWQCLRIVTGHEVPYTACSEETNAPFEWMHDLFFDRVDYSVALASRLSGKTWGLSTIEYLKGTFNEGYTLKHAAAVKKQAMVASTYLKEFARDEALGKVFEGRVYNQVAQWKNHSIWELITGSAEGVSSQHPVFASFDEIEFWDWYDLDQTWFLPQSKGDYRKIWAAVSTRQRSFGSMNRLVNEAEERGIKKYQWNVFETMRRCPSCVCIEGGRVVSNPEEKCVLWEACHGKKGIKSSGWVPREEVEQLCRTLGGPNSLAWQTQGLCARPSTKGLVYANFEHKYRTDGGNYTKWEYMADLPWYAVHDPAEGKKSVLYFVQFYQGSSYFFDELVQDECPNTTTTKVEFYKKCKLMGLPDPVTIIVDPRRTDSIADWKTGTVEGEEINHRYFAEFPDIDQASGGHEIVKGIEEVRTAIQDGWGRRTLFINPEKCPHGVLAMREYHYKMDKNNEMQSDGKPSDDYKDEADPFRYWQRYANKRLNAGPKSIHVL